MDLNLKGKTALITGGSKGIGKVIATRLAAEGCQLHFAARNADDLENTAADLRASYSVDVCIHPMDLAVFLVSSRAAYISGTVVTIDGGLSSKGHLFS